MIRRFDISEGNSTVIRYDVLNDDGERLQQADVDTVYYHVYETETNTRKTPTDGQEVEVTDAIYDTAQPWDTDSSGYNVRIKVAGAYVPDGGRTYRVEVRIALADGSAFYLDPIELRAHELYSE